MNNPIATMDRIQATEGKASCCAVLDACSRRIVGWSVDRRATSAMVNTALGMAVEQPQGALIHTDHGPQFTSWTFSQNIRSSGFGPVDRQRWLGNISPVEFERQQRHLTAA